MYIRKARVKGATYYSVVEGYRDELGRVKQKAVASLGRNATIPAAIHALKAEIEAEKEKFVGVVTACVRLWREDGFDPIEIFERVTREGLPENAEETGILEKMLEELDFWPEDSEVAENAQNDQELPWILRAGYKLSSIYHRIEKKRDTLRTLERIEPTFRRP